MSFCDGCGKQVSTDTPFCPECGRRLQPPTAPKKTESKKGVIVAAFLVALILGIVLGSTFNPQLGCAPCPSTRTLTEPLMMGTTYNVILMKTVATTTTETIVLGITRESVVSDRTITVRLFLGSGPESQERISTGASRIGTFVSYSFSLIYVCGSFGLESTVTYFLSQA